MFASVHGRAERKETVLVYVARKTTTSGQYKYSVDRSTINRYGKKFHVSAPNSPSTASLWPLTHRQPPPRGSRNRAAGLGNLPGLRVRGCLTCSLDYTQQPKPKSPELSFPPADLARPGNPWFLKSNSFTSKFQLINSLISWVLLEFNN